MSILAILALTVLTGIAFAETAREDLFASPAEAVRVMESPFRARWQMPEEVIAALEVAPGMAVADIGAGAGYFTVLFSKKVGLTGVVYAIDIDDKMLEYVTNRAQREGLSNVQGLLAKPDDPLLADASVDLAFLCNTYTYIEKRKEYLAKVRRLLKKGGRLAIIDFLPAGTPVGPPANRRMAKEVVIQDATQAGFSLLTRHEFLPYQYFIVFTPRIGK